MTKSDPPRYQQGSEEAAVVNVVRQAGVCLANLIAFAKHDSVRHFNNAEASFEELGIRIVELMSDNIEETL